MKLLFSALFKTHWLGRICQLLLVLAILAWQARYVARIRNPMYGWPIPFNNTWYSNVFEWHPIAFSANVIFWCCLLGSLSYVFNRFQNRNFNLKTLLALQVAVALLIVACNLEFHLRENPNNGIIHPRLNSRRIVFGLTSACSPIPLVWHLSCESR